MGVAELSGSTLIVSGRATSVPSRAILARQTPFRRASERGRASSRYQQQVRPSGN